MYDRLTDYWPVDRQHAKFHFVIRIKKLLGHEEIGPFKSSLAALTHARKNYSSSKYQIVQINKV
jgi:hypothetical protein